MHSYRFQGFHASGWHGRGAVAVCDGNERAHQLQPPASSDAGRGAELITDFKLQAPGSLTNPIDVCAVYASRHDR